MNGSNIYALDFDGVICDSAIETGISGWKAAYQIWPDMPKDAPSTMVELFRQVRPIIETGYEAILTMRSLYLGESVASLFMGCTDKFLALMQEAQLDSNDLKKLFGATRDQWIASDKTDWIVQNPLFPGLTEKLIRLTQNNICYIVTTKQERFVKMILDANHIELGAEHIFGLDRNLSKIAVLTLLQSRHPDQTLHFVEDRLPTLLKVTEHPELAAIQLSFAAWGYNTAEDKNQATAQGFILQQLTEFLADV
jgi:phosphoglycolate phosphatase-like HAD superfamily hydrolase